jgi:hypothetical protein
MQFQRDMKDGNANTSDGENVNSEMSLDDSRK